MMNSALLDDTINDCRLSVHERFDALRDKIKILEDSLQEYQDAVLGICEFIQIKGIDDEKTEDDNHCCGRPRCKRL